MDGTLVSQPDIIPRPFLAEFLKYCFRSFNSVSIWTAASREHFNFVNETIFKPILDEIKGEWGFVYTEERCSVVYIVLIVRMTFIHVHLLSNVLKRFGNVLGIQSTIR